MADHELSTLLTGGAFFEGPRWRQNRWWVSDFYRHGVYTVAADGTEELVERVDGQPSGLGWMPDGSLLIVSMKDRTLLRRMPEGRVAVHADLAPHCAGLPNDMVVDAQGRAYVGDFGFDLMAGTEPQPTSLKRVDPDGTVTPVADGLLFPNGTVITPDGSTLIVGETLGGRYTAFAIGEDGSLTDRRVWAQLAETPDPPSMRVGVAPDGCALDAEGHIWCADAVGSRAIRIAPGGDVVDEVPMPDGLGCYACMLGGLEGDVLLLCAAPDFFEHERAKARDAVLLTTTVAVPHAGLP